MKKLYAHCVVTIITEDNKLVSHLKLQSIDMSFMSTGYISVYIYIYVLYKLCVSNQQSSLQLITLYFFLRSTIIVIVSSINCCGSCTSSILLFQVDIDEKVGEQDKVGKVHGEGNENISRLTVTFSPVHCKKQNHTGNSHFINQNRYSSGNYNYKMLISQHSCKIKLKTKHLVKTATKQITDHNIMNCARDLPMSRIL